KERQGRSPALIHSTSGPSSAPIWRICYGGAAALGSRSEGHPPKTWTAIPRGSRSSARHGDSCLVVMEVGRLVISLGRIPNKHIRPHLRCSKFGPRRA